MDDRDLLTSLGTGAPASAVPAASRKDRRGDIAAARKCKRRLQAFARNRRWADSTLSEGDGVKNSRIEAPAP